MNPPTTSDPLDALLAHNYWATRLILDKCLGLSDEQFHRPFPIGPGDHGGLHAILTHVISAMYRWSDRIAGRPVRPTIERTPQNWSQATNARDRTPGELLALLDEAQHDLASAVAEARRRGLNRLITVELGSPEGPRKYLFTAGVAVTHAITHGHYHRAQCMNILRHLRAPGVSERLPDLDVVDWQHEVECAG